MSEKQEKYKVKPKVTLFNVAHDYVELMNEIEEAEGELTPELAERLEINEKHLQTKSVAYLEVIRGKEAFNLMIDEEIKRLQAMKKRNNTLINNLKDRLVGAVNLFGEFTVGTVTFSTRKSVSLVIEDETKIPQKYQVKTVTTKPDKKAIKDAINEGEEIKGAYLSENRNLKIK